MMGSIAESLRRFVDPESGPATSIESAPYPSYLRRQYWHSISPVHPRWIPESGKLTAMVYAGGGWSRDREESQCKAVVEAVERWAFRFHALHAPQEAGLDADPTSNGFAAMPASLGEGPLESAAYCEALERWALAVLWDEGSFPVRKQEAPTNSAVSALFRTKDAPMTYSTELRPGSRDVAGAATLHFALCLIKTEHGGVLPGSACRISLDAAMEHAACEARIHLNAFEKLLARPQSDIESMIEERLVYFGRDPTGFDKVHRRLKLCAHPVLDAPSPSFSRRLAGDWEPEVLVHRVMVNQSRHINEGGIERFII